MGPGLRFAHPGMGEISTRVGAVGIAANVQEVESKARFGVSSKSVSFGFAEARPCAERFTTGENLKRSRAPRVAMRLSRRS